jgi:serpin B
MACTLQSAWAMNTRPFLLALGTLIAACGGSTESDPSGPGPEVAKSSLARDDASKVPAESVAAVVAADNAFGFDLFGKVRQGELAAKNALVSPASLSLALSMTYAGARGATADEMAKVLHFDKLGPAAHAAHNALDQALATRAGDALAWATSSAKRSGASAPQPSDYRLRLVNSVWGDKSYTWETPFLDTLARSYGAGVYLADFVRQFEAERVRINGWVSDETQKKINDLIQPGGIDDATRMVLVNAVHLKLPWETPFELSMTRPGEFVRTDGSKVTASYMKETESVPYFEDDRAQVAAIPLSGRKVSLVVARPKGDLPTFESGLDAAWWQAARSKAVSQPVALALPKFDFTTSSIKLKPALETLGMKAPFDPGAADFLGMCSRPPNGERLYVAEVVHKAMMAVDEHGVEAAAATAVIMAGATSVGPEPKALALDKPFVVAIVDEPTGAILFLGHVNDPTDKGGS